DGVAVAGPSAATLGGREADPPASRGRPGVRARAGRGGAARGGPVGARDRPPARYRRAGRGPPPPSEAVLIGVAALGAPAQAHDRGVLHLALDPDDVIVAEDGRVCLID